MQFNRSNRMRVGVLGINHKLADLELRELLAKACQRRLAPSHSTHGEHSFILLSTCNRTEVYFSSEDLANTHSYLLSILRNDVCDDFDQKLYSYFGQDCLLHLCRVTAGLDSAIVAETEIQGQVKNAYESAQEYHRLPFEQHYLFQKALGIAKKVRSVLPTKPGIPDIEHAIFQTGQHLFKNSLQTKILFIGASGINEKILSYLKSKQLNDVSLCNRSSEKGLKIAEQYNVPFVPWKELASWHLYDWIILGTKSPEYLLNCRQLPDEKIGQKLIIDLSVPRNADPLLARHSEITLLNIDQINRRLKIRRQRLLHSLNLAEEMVSESIQQQVQLFHEKEKTRLRLCGVV